MHECVCFQDLYKFFKLWQLRQLDQRGIYCAFKLVSLTQVVVQVIKYGIYTQIHSLNSGRQANPKGPQYIWVFCPTG